MNLAPNLFQMVARKGRSVRQELQNNNWMRTFRNQISTAQHMEEFISMWIRIQSVQLQEGTTDSITWRWTADGSYTTRSAYRIQFKGAYSIFSPKLIWKADTENKCKVFMWIFIHEKILTTDNLQKRQWPYHEHCALCNGPLETAVHLCLNCGFAKVVWNQIFTWEGVNIELLQMQDEPIHFRTWWEQAAPQVSKDQRRKFNGMVIYTCWNLWKECNRRIFDNAFQSAREVAMRIKEDIDQRRRALRIIG